MDFQIPLGLVKAAVTSVKGLGAEKIRIDATQEIEGAGIVSFSAAAGAGSIVSHHWVPLEGFTPGSVCLEVENLSKLLQKCTVKEDPILRLGHTNPGYSKRLPGGVIPFFFRSDRKLEYVPSKHLTERPEIRLSECVVEADRGNFHKILDLSLSTNPDQVTITVKDSRLSIVSIGDIAAAELRMKVTSLHPFEVTLTRESAKFLVAVIGRYKKDSTLCLQAEESDLRVSCEEFDLTLPLGESSDHILPPRGWLDQVMEISDKDLKVPEDTLRNSLGVGLFDFDEKEIHFVPKSGQNMVLCNFVRFSEIAKKVLKLHKKFPLKSQGNLYPLGIDLGDDGLVWIAPCDPEYSRFGLPI